MTLVSKLEVTVLRMYSDDVKYDDISFDVFLSKGKEPKTMINSLTHFRVGCYANHNLKVNP